MKTKTKTFSVQKCPQIFVVILRFSTNSKVKTKKKRSSSPKFYEIRCESTKTTKKQFLLENSWAIRTNLRVLGLDLHSCSPEPVNFFGAQSSLGGGHKQSFGGAPPRDATRGAGPSLMGTRVCFQRSGSSSFEFLFAEGDSVERYDRNVLQGTFCFQLSAAFQFYCYIPFTKVESSRTHFEVLRLQASSSRKLPSPRLENSSVFRILKIL